MRSRRGLGMVLHTIDWLPFVPHALDCLIVQVDTIHAYVRRQRFCVHRETVILRRDLHLAAFEILHRLVSAAMAEFQLERLPAERLPEDLVPQANPENGNVLLYQV